jgi:hypothetical protein
MENNRFVPKQVQIQALPLGRALVNEQEAFEGEGDGLMGHGMVFITN